MATLLLIDDSAAQRALIRRALAPVQVFDRVLEATEGLLGLSLLLNEQVDVVLCDLEMPGFDGAKVLQIKQSNSSSRDTPFLFITACEDLDRKARLLELGACDLIAKPFHPADLVARLKLHLKTKRLHDELRHKSETMAKLSTSDPVTGLRTRRYVSEALSVEVLRARRYQTALAVIMADLDHFKRVNDEYGHLSGDRVLHGVSGELLKQVRATDVAGRFGGEEILVVLAHSGADGALVLAERWRMQVEAARFESFDGRPIGVQISCGVAAFDSTMTSADELIARADAALYAAKEGGRNQVVVDG